MAKIKILIPGGELEIESGKREEIFQELSFWQSLPLICPIDDCQTRLLYKKPQSYEYYGIVSTGPVPFEYKLSFRKDDKEMYTKEVWALYDPEKDNETILWQHGKFTPAGVKVRRQIIIERNATKPEPAKQEPAKAAAQTEPTPAPKEPAQEGNQPDVFNDPAAGAFADRRPELVAEISAIAAKAYGTPKHHSELQRIGREVAAKEIAGLMDLSHVELGKVKAIVSLDATGLEKFKDKWYPKLAKTVEARGKGTIYEFSTQGIDEIHKTVLAAIGAAKVQAGAK